MKTSDAWLDLLAYRREEALGRKLTDFMTEESKRRFEETVWPSLQRGGEIRRAEYQFVRKSGEILDVLLSAREEQSDGEPVRTLGGLIDITSRKRAEEALRQSQRMEAIGQLTGGVAHDFNNLLMVISGAAEKLQRTFADNRASMPLGMIATAVKRGQKLTGHLLSFARRQTLETAVVDLAEILPHVSEMLKRSLRGDIEIRTSAPDCPCRTRVDAGELELALLNLGVNARDAMSHGGVLSLAVRKVRLAGEAEVDGLCGEFVAMELKDCGVGIPPELLPNVFDPFFTTKGAGKGTGLGLSQVYGFAKQSGGTAKIQSKPGDGTTVSIICRRRMTPCSPTCSLRWSRIRPKRTRGRRCSSKTMRTLPACRPRILNNSATLSKSPRTDRTHCRSSRTAAHTISSFRIFSCPAAWPASSSPGSCGEPSEYSHSSRHRLQPEGAGSRARRLHHSSQALRPAQPVRSHSRTSCEIRTGRVVRDQAHVMVVKDDALVLSAICSLLEIVGYRVTGVASIGEALKQAHNQNDISLLITDFHLANGELGTEVIQSIRSVLGRDVKAFLLTGDTSVCVQIIARENDAFLMSKPINADEFLGLLAATSGSGPSFDHVAAGSTPESVKTKR